MSYVEDVNTRQQDTADIDAAGRTRVSELTTQIDIKQIYDNRPLLIDEVLNGAATATYDATTSSTELVTSNSGDYAIKQTFQKFNYQSGKSQLIFMTINGFAPSGDTTKRVGYFDSSIVAPYTASLDGLYLQSDSTEVSVNIALNGTVTSVAQSSFNLDPLDGTGASGLTVDWDLNQILVIDFLWLGVSRVRWGLDVGGLITYFHESNHANVTTDVYMTSPNKPLRWEIRQTGATGDRFKYICASVNSEGSVNKIGKVLSSNASDNDVQCNSAGTAYANIGIRLKSTHLDSVIDILQFDYLSETNDNALWELVLNPTVTGTFVYSDVANSSVQTSVGNQTGGAAPTSSGGTVIASGYVSANSTISSTVDSAIRLGSKIDGTLDEIVLVITPITGGLDTFVSFTWKELT